MSAEVDRMKQEVAETRGAIESGIAFIKSLIQKIRDLRDDPAALTALADDLDAQQKALAEAIATDPDA